MNTQGYYFRYENRYHDFKIVRIDGENIEAATDRAFEILDIYEDIDLCLFTDLCPLFSELN